MRKLTLSILLIPSFYLSQVRTAIDALDNQRGKVFDVKKSDSNIYSGVDGTPYVTDEFKSITVEGYSDKLPPIRYNAYADEMEFKQGETLNYIDKSAGDIRIKFEKDKKTYLLLYYTYNDKNKHGYLVEHIEGGKGKYGLYTKENVIIIENQNSTTNSYLKQKNPYFQREKDLKLLSFDNSFQKFPRNAKELKTLVKTDNSKLSEYLKNNKVDFGKLDDQIKLVNFLNTL